MNPIGKIFNLVILIAGFVLVSHGLKLSFWDGVIVNAGICIISAYYSARP